MRRFIEFLIAAAATAYLLGMIIPFLADVHGVVLPEDVTTALILLSSAGLAVTVSFGTALLAGSGHRNRLVTAGWLLVLLLLSFLLWPYFRTGIAGSDFEKVLEALHPKAPDLFSWMGTFIGEIMLALVFFNRSSGSGGGSGASAEEWTDLLNTVTNMSQEIDRLKQLVSGSGATPEQAPKQIPEQAPKRAPERSSKQIPESIPDAAPELPPTSNREIVLAALRDLGEADTPTLVVATKLTRAQVNNALKNNDQITREPITQPSPWKGRTLYRPVEDA